jgi:hypothetical protein
MKPKYLETYDYRRLKDYCSNKCINIVFEQNDKEENEKPHLRGLYRGYLYGMKLFSTLLQREKRVMNYELYNHLKYYKSHKTKMFSEDKAIYDIMNLISE